MISTFLLLLFLLLSNSQLQVNAFVKSTRPTLSHISTGGGTTTTGASTRWHKRDAKSTLVVLKFDTSDQLNNNSFNNKQLEEDTKMDVAKSSSSSQSLSSRRKQLLRQQGGPLTFDTPLGAINPYGIYFGLVAITLGLIWAVALSGLQLVYKLTDNKFDPKRRIVVWINHIWGTCLMKLTGTYPTIENAELLQDNNKAMMIVANHNSWMDIPYVGAAIGWQDNYRFVAKSEIATVPILGQAIVLAKSVLLDRSSPKSQLLTLKTGISTLRDDKVHLVAFPEGTRSKAGRLQDFKNGAFKMAHKTKSPVVPLSIVGSGNVMPPGWLFPYQPNNNDVAVAKVVVHPPIDSSQDMTEKELAEAVRQAIISGLPQDQQPPQEIDQQPPSSYSRRRVHT